MTDCNQLDLVFSNLGRKKIQADFAGGKLTSDAGAALLREVDRRISLIDALTDCIVDPRQADKITHDLRTMLAQRILALAIRSRITCSYICVSVMNSSISPCLGKCTADVWLYP